MKVEISNIQTTDNINLSQNQCKALRELICVKNLIINKADKGSTIVVQNRADYIQWELGLSFLPVAVPQKNITKC